MNNTFRKATISAGLGAGLSAYQFGYGANFNVMGKEINAMLVFAGVFALSSMLGDAFHTYVFPEIDSSAKHAQLESSIANLAISGGSAIMATSLLNPGAITQVGNWNLGLAGAGVEVLSTYLNNNFFGANVEE